MQRIDEPNPWTSIGRVLGGVLLILGALGTAGAWLGPPDAQWQTVQFHDLSIAAAELRTDLTDGKTPLAAAVVDDASCDAFAAESRDAALGDPLSASRESNPQRVVAPTHPAMPWGLFAAGALASAVLVAATVLLSRRRWFASSGLAGRTLSLALSASVLVAAGGGLMAWEAQRLTGPRGPTDSPLLPALLVGDQAFDALGWVHNPIRPLRHHLLHQALSAKLRVHDVPSAAIVALEVQPSDELALRQAAHTALTLSFRRALERSRYTGAYRWATAMERVLPSMGGADPRLEVLPYVMHELAKSERHGQAANLMYRHREELASEHRVAWANLVAQMIVKQTAEAQYETVRALEGYARAVPDPAYLATLNCFGVYAGMVHAKEAFDSGAVEQAVTVARDVWRRAPTDAEATQSLSAYLHVLGMKSLETDPASAVKSLEEGHRLRPEDTQLTCNLALALTHEALDQAFTRQFDLAAKSLLRAEELCRFEGLDTQVARVELAIAEASLRSGDLDEARRSLQTASERGNPQQRERATALELDSYQAAKRIEKIGAAFEWVAKESDKRAPIITGSMCTFSAETGDCDGVHFFVGDKLLGASDAAMHQVELEHGTDVVVLQDLMKDGRIDSVEFAEGPQRRRLIESDGDSLIDAEVLFDRDGEILDTKIHSGRVAVKVPSGVISQKVDPDWFGTCPDAYLVVYQNGEYVGATRPSVNRCFPSWRDAFVVDVKRGDRLVFYMWDDDSGLFKDLGWDEDDFIDSFLMRQFPVDKIMIGRHGKAAIEILARPSEMPPGVYEVADEDWVNIFESGNFDNHPEAPALHSMIEEARRGKEINDAAAVVLSTTVPEIAVYVLMAEMGIAYQLAAALLGGEAMYLALENGDTP